MEFHGSTNLYRKSGFGLHPLRNCSIAPPAKYVQQHATAGFTFTSKLRPIWRDPLWAGRTVRRSVIVLACTKASGRKNRRDMGTARTGRAICMLQR